jgi:hydrogenase-4 component F
MYQLYFIVSIFIALFAIVLKNDKLSHLLSLIHVGFTGYIGVFALKNIGTSYFYHLFNADSLSVVFIFIAFLVGLAHVVAYYIYAKNREETHKTITLHNAFFVLFITAIVGVNISYHFGMIWAFIEATTLTGAVLIYHDRVKLAVEAVWKYIYVCSISIALAFTGILFLSLASSKMENIDFTFKAISAISTDLDTVWLKASFLFVLVGFSVKLGAIPMFNVDIDAKDLSPSPTGALFSSILLNAGFLAVYRFYAAFANSSIHEWMNHVLIISGILSILFAAAYVLKVNNYKRVLAYSSMEHSGIVLIALSLGKIGAFIAVLHLIFHSLVKSGLFFQIGEIYSIYKSKTISSVKRYFGTSPIGAITLLLGVLSIVALPPSGIFITEFMLFKSLLTTNAYTLFILIALLLSIVMYGLLKGFLMLFFVKHEETENDYSYQPKIWNSIPSLMLILGTFVLGIYQPHQLIEFINQSINLLP